MHMPNAYTLIHMLLEYKLATICTPTYLYTCILSMYTLTINSMNACPLGTSKYVIFYNQLIRTIGNIKWPAILGLESKCSNPSIFSDIIS
jgi:hypothetical protein